MLDSPAPDRFFDLRQKLLAKTPTLPAIFQTGGRILAATSDPAAIPPGVGLQLAFLPLGGGAAGHEVILGRAALVHASSPCTS